MKNLIFGLAFLFSISIASAECRHFEFAELKAKSTKTLKYEFCIAGLEIQAEQIRHNVREMNRCFDEQSRISDLLAKRKVKYDDASCERDRKPPSAEELLETAERRKRLGL